MLDVILKVRERFDVGLDDIASVQATVPPLIHRLVARGYKPDMTPAYARLCLPFLAGLALRDGSVDPRKFGAETFSAAEIAVFADKVEIKINDQDQRSMIFSQPWKISTSSPQVSFPCTMESLKKTQTGIALCKPKTSKTPNVRFGNERRI